MDTDQRQIVIVSDIHGCLEEFEELLEKINYDVTKHRLIIGGDILDRGPFPVACLRKVRDMNLECVLGNHEEWAIRWRKHLETEIRTGKKNPMPPKGEKRTAENAALSDEDMEWIRNLPLMINIQDNWWLLHGGCEPGIKLKDQDPKQIIRCRYIGENGRAVSLNKDKSQPAGSSYWTEVWDGPESVVYGHCVHSLTDMRIDTRPNGVKCIGIDTGCVFGGFLSALMFPSMETVQVQARQVYKKL